jgi:hypothetical protein
MFCRREIELRHQQFVPFIRRAYQQIVRHRMRLQERKVEVAIPATIR